MRVKDYKPVTPGLRHAVVVNKSGLYRGGPFKGLSRGITRTGGRNNRGVITSRGIGGGAKRRYREIDFQLYKKVIGEAEVLRIEYDPNRTAFIALLRFSGVASDNFAYTIASAKMAVGSKVFIGSGADICDGNVLPLAEVPIGFTVYNVSTKLNAGTQMARAAGAYAVVTSKDGNNVSLKMRSGRFISVNSKCFAAIGVASNVDHRNVVLGKAGRARWLGRRPKVRGVAMNPVDHPHGGGEGKSGTGGAPMTPWGKLTKGAKTVFKRGRK